MHGSGVLVATKRDRHRISRLCRSRYLSTDGLVNGDFSGVDNVITRHGINNHPWQERFDIHRMRGTAAVACAVGGTGANRINRLAQCAHRRSGHGDAPVTGTVGGRAVSQTIEHHGDRGACRQAAGDAADDQVLGFLRIINNVIAGDGVDGQRRAAEINRHIVSRAVAVARAIAQAGGDGLAAGCQCRNICRRNANTPVTGGVQRGGVVFTVERDGNHITGFRTCAGTCDNQRLPVFDGIDDVIARDGVNGEIRRDDIHRQRMIRACQVTRFVAHRGGNGITAGS